jgi:transposase
MSHKQKKRYSGEFKAKVAFEAIKGEKTISQLSSEYGIHGTSINQWRRELLQGAAQVFEGGRKAPASETATEALVEKLYAKVGQLTVERDFLSKALKS